MADDIALAQLTLTTAERLILANQYRILEQLHVALRHEYASRRHVVEQGAVEHYDRLLSQPGTTVGEVPSAERTPGRSSHTVRQSTSPGRPNSSDVVRPRGWAEEDDTAGPDRGGALTPW